MLPVLPAYMEETYWWAYLRPASLRLFDHVPVVSAILWGWYGRLKRAAFEEIGGARRVLQAACVYGDLSQRLAARLEPAARLEVIDVAPIQVDNCRRKLAAFPSAGVRLADAAAPGGGPYDLIVCFFLLHEVPDPHKRRIVDALLASLTPGGKLVFVDYHRPHPLHPLKPVMSLVFDTLEPFAKSLWRHEIESFASPARSLSWRKDTYFGGLYQKVVVRRPPRPPLSNPQRAA
jgi:SAM-dependent methyltransferase